IFLDHRTGFRQIGKLICKEKKFLRILASQIHYRFVTATIGGQPVLRTSRKQDGFLNSESPLMCYQSLIASAQIVGVLVKVDNGLRCVLSEQTFRNQSGADSHERAS